MKLSRYAFAFAALATAIYAAVIEPVVSAIERTFEYMRQACAEILSTDSFVIDTGSADMLRWSGERAFDRSLQLELEHERAHLRRSAARNI